MRPVIKQSARLLRVSTTRIDGGQVFGATPKERWETFAPPDRQNRVALGNYSMLLPSKEGWIIVDTGPGDKAPMSTDIAPTRSRSSLLRELRELGIMPRDVAVVILTHLRSEHAGGATHCTSSGRVLPTFPFARHVIQRSAWEEASHPNERHFRHYRRDDFEPLAEYGEVQLVDGCAEVAEGVWVEAAPGPTAGHQIVKASVGGYQVAFLGVLVPTLMHLTPNVMSASDWDPQETARMRQQITRQALAEKLWLAPVGCDRWVEAEELLDLSLWRRAIGDTVEEAPIAFPEPVVVSA